MSDTLGGLIDKLVTVDMKMWNNQEFLYAARRMGFEQFKKTYLTTEEDQQKLYESIKKCCDLNVQRNQIIDEVDLKVIEMIKFAQQGHELDEGKFIQRKHKTY